jgi:hypothetical protein
MHLDYLRHLIVSQTSDDIKETFFQPTMEWWATCPGPFLDFARMAAQSFLP